MALWRDATAGALGPGQGDYDPYGDLSSLVRQIAPGIGSAAQTALQPQLRRPDDSFAAYMADPLARSDADIQQRAAAGLPSAGQSLSDLGNMVLPYLAGAAPGGSLSSGIRRMPIRPGDISLGPRSTVDLGKESSFWHDLLDSQGTPAGHIAGWFEGPGAHIESISGRGGANALGPMNIRGLLQQFREAYPDVTSISGERVTGARAGGNQNYYEAAPGDTITILLNKLAANRGNGGF
jgi:hypothetical protein